MPALQDTKRIRNPGGVKVVATFNGVVLYDDESLALASRGLRLFVRRSCDGPWAVLSDFDFGSIKRLSSRNRLLSRLTRWMIHHAFPISADRILVSAAGRLFTISSQTSAILSSHIYGFRRPLALAAHGTKIYFGEYRDNPRREPVYIWGSEDSGAHWSVVRGLSAIRHIHGIFHDLYTDAFWICTGDKDTECSISFTRDGFKTLQTVAQNNQMSRAVQLLFTPDAVYFCSDAPDDPNFVRRLDRKTGQITNEHPLPGPVFFGVTATRHMVFSTVCEPSQVNDTHWIHMVAGADASWTTLLSMRGDALPRRLFQYPQLLFAQGIRPDGKIWITPFATPHDRTALLLDLSAALQN